MAELIRSLRRRWVVAFPTHWSQMLPVIALSSLVVLIASGVYLAVFFDPSMAQVTYVGPVENLRGADMTRAYASALEISFEVRGGLFMRQLHHWAAAVFIASLLASLAAMFFTGAFRQPRRTIWTVDVLLVLVGVLAAFTGVLLLGDLLSGTSLRMISGYLLSIPVVGTWLHWMLFGSEFPGTEVIPRLYLVHLLLPGILIALVALRTALVRRHGHPQYRGATIRNASGARKLPGLATRAAVLGMATAGVLAVMAGVFQANPIWNYGPANPAQVSAGSTSPWYFGWVDGAVRLWPAWDIHLGGYTIPAAFWPSMVFLPLTFIALACYPWIERRRTGDDAPHHLLQRPRDVPRRTSLGVAVLIFYGCLQLAAAIDILAFTFQLSAEALLWACRIGVFVLPPLAYTVTYRLCLGLQRADRAVLEHGIETGIIQRLPHGEFLELHQPLGGTDSHGHPIPLQYRGTPVPKKMNQLGAAGRPARGSFLHPDPPEPASVSAKVERHAPSPRHPAG